MIHEREVLEGADIVARKRRRKIITVNEVVELLDTIRTFCFPIAIFAALCCLADLLIFKEGHYPVFLFGAVLYFIATIIFSAIRAIILMKTPETF